MTERLSLLLDINFDSDEEIYNYYTLSDSETEYNIEIKDINLYEIFLNNLKKSPLIDKAIKLYEDRKKIPPPLPSPRTRERIKKFFEKILSKRNLN
jgi:hypothetical protein